ncbi:uncharacterized protein LOC119721545 [Patiria miniata]|uniref:Uncharacterized protein n=1 Tax=Patiria miniata TaxID=46514 RepID=A0A913Z6W6_PATMI|nr:uncharacterized protein LOC119721545 [Patiria miniata]
MYSVIRKSANLLVVILACYSSLYLSGCVLGKSPVSLPCLPTIVTSWQTGSVVITDATDDYSINDEKFKFYRELSSVWAELFRSFHPMPSPSSKHAATNVLQDFIADVVHFLNSCWMNSDAQAAMISLATWYLSVATLIGIASRVFSPRPRQVASRPRGDSCFKIPGPSFYNLRHGPVSASPQSHVSWHRVTYLGLYLIFGVPLGIWWIYSRPIVHPSQFGASSVPWSLATHLLNLIKSLLERAIEMLDQLNIQSPLANTKGLGYFVAAAALCFSYLLVLVALSLLMQQPKRKYRLTHARRKCCMERMGSTLRVMSSSAILGILTALRYVSRCILILPTSRTTLLAPHAVPDISGVPITKGANIVRCKNTHTSNSDGNNSQTRRANPQPNTGSEGVRHNHQHDQQTAINLNVHIQPKVKGETLEYREQVQDQEEATQALGIQQRSGENSPDDVHHPTEFQQPSPRKSLFQRMAEAQLRLQTQSVGKLHKMLPNELQKQKVRKQGQKHAQQPQDLKRQVESREQADLKQQDLNTTGCFRFNAWNHPELPSLDNHIRFFAERIRKEKEFQSLSGSANPRNEHQRRREASKQVRLDKQHDITQHLHRHDVDSEGCLHFNSWHSRRFSPVVNLLTVFPQRYAEYDGKTWFQQSPFAKHQSESGTEFQLQVEQLCQKKTQKLKTWSRGQELVLQQEDLAEPKQQTESSKLVEQQPQYELQKRLPSPEEKSKEKLDQQDQQRAGPASEPSGNPLSKHDIRTRRRSVWFADDASLKETAFIVKNPSSEIVSNSVIKPDSPNSKPESCSKTLKGILADARRQRRSCPRPWIALPPLPGGQRRAQRRAIAVTMNTERCRAWAIELEKETRAESSSRGASTNGDSGDRGLAATCAG